MNSTIFSRTRTARRIAAACGSGVLLLGAGACGSDDTTSNTTGTTNQASTNGSGSTSQQGGARPGADGKVAAVADSTAQVQSQQNGQVAVTWNASTTFTKQVAAKLADVQVGDCVMVTSAQSATAGSTSQPTQVTATSVRITEPVSGTCTPAGAAPGAGSGNATRGGGPQLGGQPPAGVQVAPGDGSRPQIRMMGGAFGTVKSVSSTGFVVTATRPASTGDKADAAETTEVTVTVAKATTYSATAEAAAADVKVGVCVRADGKTDQTGAVTASRIAITPSVGGECGAMFVRSSAGTDNSSKAS